MNVHKIKTPIKPVPRSRPFLIHQLCILSPLFCSATSLINQFSVYAFSNFVINFQLPQKNMLVNINLFIGVLLDLWINLRWFANFCGASQVVLMVKNFPANSGDAGDEGFIPGFDPWAWKILWRRKWQPAPIFLPGKSHRLRSLVGYSPWDPEKMDMTEGTEHTCKM